MRLGWMVGKGLRVGGGWMVGVGLRVEQSGGWMVDVGGGDSYRVEISVAAGCK